MKKALSIVLVLTLLLLSGANPAIALEESEGPFIVTEETLDELEIGGTTFSSIDDLMSQRADLLIDSEDNQEQIDLIDRQLCAAGVEYLTYAEVCAKMGKTAAPMYNVTSTSDTTWKSIRVVTVHNGERMEVQMIYGQMKDDYATTSPLYANYPDVYRGKPPSTLAKAIEVLADDIVTAGVSAIDPVIGSSLDGIITIADILQNCISVSVSSTENYAFNVGVVTTMKLAYVKYEGAVDEGHQILGYVGNQAKYTVSVLVPCVIDGEPDTYTVKYKDTMVSYGYGSTQTSTDDCKAIAARNYWNYKHGISDFSIYHDIWTIPIKIMDARFNANVPRAYP